MLPPMFALQTRRHGGALIFASYLFIIIFCPFFPRKWWYNERMLSFHLGKGGKRVHGGEMRPIWKLALSPLDFRANRTLTMLLRLLFVCLLTWTSSARGLADVGALYEEFRGVANIDEVLILSTRVYTVVAFQKVSRGSLETVFFFHFPKRSSEQEQNHQKQIYIIFSVVVHKIFF